MVSGIATDELAELFSLIPHTRSIWLTVPISILTYLVEFAVVQWVLARGARAER